VNQLDRQIGTQFYERTLLSRDQAAMLRRGQGARPGDAVTSEEPIKDPFVLEVRQECPLSGKAGKSGDAAILAGVTRRPLQ